MSNLFNCEQITSEEELSQKSFMQPFLITREGSYEMLKLLGITIDNINRVIDQNLKLYQPNADDKV